MLGNSAVASMFVGDATGTASVASSDGSVEATPNSAWFDLAGSARAGLSLQPPFNLSGMQRELNKSRHRFYKWLGKLADNATVVFDNMQTSVNTLAQSVAKFDTKQSQRDPTSGGKHDARPMLVQYVDYFRALNETRTSRVTKTPTTQSMTQPEQQVEPGVTRAPAKSGTRRLGKAYYGLPPDDIMDAYVPKVMVYSGENSCYR